MKLVNTISTIIKPYVVAIPTYNRYTILYHKTLNTLFNCKIKSNIIYVFLASKHEYEQYINSYININNPSFKLWCKGIKCVIGIKGLKNQRNFISKFFKEGQYILQMDDDIQNILYLNYNTLEPKNKTYWQLKSYSNNKSNTFTTTVINTKTKKRNTTQLYNRHNIENHTKTTTIDKTKKSKHIIHVNVNTNLDTLIKNTFKLCKLHNIYLWGIYPVENAYFMQPYATTDLRFIVGPCFGIINRHTHDLMLTLDEKENVERTLQYWNMDGIVLRLNNVTVKTQYYTTPGGMQSEGKIRKQEALRSAEILHSRYPKLTKIYLGKKSGHPEIKLITPK
jgi:hypothetical protein